MGDIHRAAIDGADSVVVNTRFTRLNGYEYMRARQLFLDNGKINALPIVDSENKLVGDYSRWDDKIHSDIFEKFDDEEYVMLFKERIKRAAFVEGGKVFPKKREAIEKARSYLENIGIETEVVKCDDIIDSSKRNNVIFFPDEDELRGIETLYNDILGKDFGYGLKGIINYEITELHNKIGNAIASGILKKLSDTGVNVMTFQIGDNGSDYWRKMQHDISDRWIHIGRERACILYNEFREDFFDDIYSCEYAKKLSNLGFTASNNGLVTRLKDVKSDFYNVKEGERLTVGQPKYYYKTIYFYGPCVVVGQFVEDAHTIESYLQGILNTLDYKIKVVNLGSWQNTLSLLSKICMTRYQKGDIIVAYLNNYSTDGILSLNLADCLARENVPAKWFVDAPQHCNYKVNEIYAKEFYSCIEKWLDEKPSGEIAPKVETPKTDWTYAYLHRYFPDYNPKGSVGSIVMNCNPFTYGHRYLIEQALKQVDNLIIFVVEEDKSLFTFAERYAMVREGTKDLENVKIVPSGNFILSQTTFPEYFIKIEDEDLEANVEEDITLFAEAIAPQLNITYRFVGEEKSDKVTDAYNSAMKRILPEHGVKVVEIPRKVMDNESPISATEVRKRLETYPFGDLSELLPESTQRLLVQSWEKDKSFK